MVVTIVECCRIVCYGPVVGEKSFLFAEMLLGNFGDIKKNLWECCWGNFIVFMVVEYCRIVC